MKIIDVKRFVMKPVTLKDMHKLAVRTRGVYKNSLITADDIAGAGHTPEELFELRKKVNKNYRKRLMAYLLLLEVALGVNNAALIEEDFVIPIVTKATEALVVSEIGDGFKDDPVKHARLKSMALEEISATPVFQGIVDNSMDNLAKAGWFFGIAGVLGVGFSHRRRIKLAHELVSPSKQQMLTPK